MCQQNGVRCFWQRPLLLMEYHNSSMFPRSPPLHLKVRQKGSEGLCSGALKIMCSSFIPNFSARETQKLYYFSIAVVTNYHKLVSETIQTLSYSSKLILQFWKSEVQHESP